MIGNEAAARGIYEAGCEIVSSYPGTPSTEITEYVSKYSGVYSEWAPNEKVAAEVAFGASLAGARSCCCMKHVGLNVAADPLFTLSYTGVNGGMVIAVADDPGMHSSQNEQDSRHYAIASKIPMVEPSDSAECLNFMKQAFELSEQFDTPVIFRTCTRIAHSQSFVELGEKENIQKKEYIKNPQKYIMMPGNAIKRHPLVEERMQKLAAFAETTKLNSEEDNNSELGIITSGTCYQYVKEVFGDTVNILKLGLIHPLPVQKIENFAAKVSRLVVVEELDNIIEAHCRSLGLTVEGKKLFGWVGELSQQKIAAAFGLAEKAHNKLDVTLPVRPPVMCAGCPHRGIFYTLSKYKITVLGDIGCYTLGAQQPLCAMDSTLCMGASVSGLHGFNKAAGAKGESKSVAVIGDSTFMHSGITGLINISYNASNSTVIVLDNSITGMTGHQHNPSTGFNIKGEPATQIDIEALCTALGIGRVRVIDPYDLKLCQKVIREELDVEEPSVIISRRPCVLLKSFKPASPLKINGDKCTGCKSCMKLGCPAINISYKSLSTEKQENGSEGFSGLSGSNFGINKGKALIDRTLCVGCGICSQLCAFNAIESEAE